MDAPPPARSPLAPSESSSSGLTLKWIAIFPAGSIVLATTSASQRQARQAQQQHPAEHDQAAQPEFGAIDAALEAEQIPGPIHGDLQTRHARGFGDWSRLADLRFES